jgi:hypothetical protein
MNFLTKTAIASLALASMIQADTMLLGVDGGITIGGARLGVVAGITGGSARNYTAPGYSAYQTAGASCGTVAYAAAPVVYTTPVYTSTTVATTSYKPVYNTVYKPITTVSYKPVYNTTYKPVTTVNYKPVVTYQTYSTPCVSTCGSSCCN